MPVHFKKSGSTEWTPPKTFDEYRVLWTLGRGGMGEVYLGHDMLLDRAVAIKFIRSLEPDAFTREQFLTEARAAARLQHPNVVTVYRVGEIDGRPFIISEYVRGQNMDRVDRPMPWQRALELAIGLTRGLAAAHRRGVLHRDIKPGNVIIPADGGVKLLDFGLAKFIEGGQVSDLQHDTPPSAESIQSVAETIDIASATAPPAATNSVSVASPLESASAYLPTREDPPPSDESRVTVSPQGLMTLDIPNRPLGRELAALPVPNNPVEVEARAATQASFAALLARDETSELEYSSGIKGTPLYMAPEVLQGEPASRRSDIYSMGALLFELCTGAPPHANTSLPNLQKVAATTDIPPLVTVAKEVDPRFGAIVDRCLRRDPALRFGAAEELRDALEQLVSPSVKDQIPEGNPYRGLLPFEAQHRALFFGRKSEIGTLIDRLRTEAFLLVSADSGVGKSSLCRAGVLPLVADGALGSGRTYAIASLVPGRRPLSSLCASIANALTCDETALEAQLLKEPSSFARALRKLLTPGQGLFLFLDQMEELCTIGDPTQSAIVSEALASLSARGNEVRVLCTARSDFLARLATLPVLGDDITRALYLLRPMGTDKLREAVVGPALIKGVSFESDALVDSLVESTARTDGGLPLLQFALAELWEVRGSGVITAAALESIGGVAGALARHGDHVFGSLPTDQRTSARRILMSLVTLERTRARRTEEELTRSDAAARPALEALVRGRLLVARDTAEGAAYEVAHEALIRGWDTLSRWLDEHAESRAVRQRLETAAYEWHRLGRARDALWGARQLAETSLLDTHDIGPREADFLKASQVAVQRSRQLRRMALISVPVLLTALYATTRIIAHRDITRRVDALIAQGQKLLAKAQQDSVQVKQLRQQAFSLFDAKDRDKAEEVWKQSLTLAGQADRVYSQAGQRLETALTLDGHNADVRALLADALFERAQAADRDNQAHKRDDLLQRMDLYDTGGEKRRQWNQAGSVSIATEPRATEAKLEQYVVGDHQRRNLTNARSLPALPIANFPLAPGSYLLTLSAPGHETIHYPFIVERGEQVRIHVPLPPKGAIPAGYVYIPPGRFLFGSSSEDTLRRLFLNTAPQHQLTLPGYFIAANETTVAEWIEYLRDLPAEERKLRMPKVGGQTLTGSIELRELPAERWSLLIKPRTDSFTAESGQPLRYPERKRLASQNWMRFPVGGISAADVEAYTRWLSRTGRVPGARLCTEAEWERAARGADDRVYPHGDFLLPDDANFDQTHGKLASCFGPDEVGSHRSSSSPFGVEDMAGNHFEWTASSLLPDEFLARGGAYSFDELTLFTTNRNTLDAAIRNADLGARVCVTAPPALTAP